MSSEPYREDRIEMADGRPAEQLIAQGKRLVQQLLGQGTIAVPRGLAHLVGSANAALLLAQFIYWSERTTDARGWFFKIQDELQFEIGLSHDEQRTARHRLRALGLIEEREWSVPKKLHFRVIWPHVIALLSGDAQSLSYTDLITIYRSRLNRISGSAYSRALKIRIATGCRVEHVDYCDALARDAGFCYRCARPITRGPGRNDEDLAFDHVIPLKTGGDHVLANVKAMHAGCNRRKEKSQSSENQSTDQSSENQMSGHLKNRALVVRNSDVQCSVIQGNKVQETTAQTTSQKTPSETSVDKFALTPPEPPDPEVVVGEDPRFDVVKAAIQKCWRPDVPLDWSLKDSRALKQLLKNNPSWTSSQLVNSVIFRFLSDDCSKTEAPADWLKHVTRYADGPLDRFGRTKEPDGIKGRAHWRNHGLRMFFGVQEEQLPLPVTVRRQRKYEPAPDAVTFLETSLNPWRAIVELIKAETNQHSFYTWLQPGRFAGVDGLVLLVEVPNELFRRIAYNYDDEISRAARKLGAPFSAIQFISAETGEDVARIDLLEAAPKRPIVPALGLPDAEAEEGCKPRKDRRRN